MTLDHNTRRDLEIYAILRSYARDEGEHINNRLNWLGVSQSVLLTAYVALLGAVGSDDFAKLKDSLTVNAAILALSGAQVLAIVFSALALTGTALCVLTFVNVASAFKSEETIKIKWREYVETVADPGMKSYLPFLAFGYNPKGGKALPTWRIAVAVLPILFTSLWIVLGGFAVLLVLE